MSIRKLSSALFYANLALNSYKFRIACNANLKLSNVKLTRFNVSFEYYLKLFNAKL